MRSGYIEAVEVCESIFQSMLDAHPELLHRELLLQQLQTNTNNSNTNRTRVSRELPGVLSSGHRCSRSSGILRSLRNLHCTSQKIWIGIIITKRHSAYDQDELHTRLQFCYRIPSRKVHRKSVGQGSASAIKSTKVWLGQ